MTRWWACDGRDLTVTEPDRDPPVVERDGNAGRSRVQRAAEVGDDGRQDTQVFGPLRPSVGRPELVGQNPSEYGGVVVSRPDRLVPWVLRRTARLRRVRRRPAGAIDRHRLAPTEAHGRGAAV